MGFVEPESTITLRFEPGHRYHGLEAVCRSMSIGEYAQGMGWYDESAAWSSGETLEHFYAALVSWNLVDKNQQPIPVTDARNRDQRLIRSLNDAWITGLISVHGADPLADASAPGGTPPGAPVIPMQPVTPQPDPMSQVS
ncbi:hypothetical protein [Streptomyces sp. NPDC057257]|uniref:hypothetical protein n=1 Tax=Streptomyces sp. NPDC057257 TaxID=3346071 RepID=UPI003624B39A